jgi:hypothetical protein
MNYTQCELVGVVRVRRFVTINKLVRVNKSFKSQRNLTQKSESNIKRVTVVGVVRVKRI